LLELKNGILCQFCAIQKFSRSSARIAVRQNAASKIH
jgi:hypothetical protein